MRGCIDIGLIVAGNRPPAAAETANWYSGMTVPWELLPTVELEIARADI